MSICKTSLVITLILVATIYTTNYYIKPRITISEQAKSFQLKNRPALVAHRGGRGVRPENTLTAMKLSYEYYKPDVLETDIRITKDGEFIFSHDGTLERTTNGTGYIRDHTLEELKSLDFGYHYTDGKTYPHRGKGVQCTTLKEAYNEFKDKNILMSVEIKDREVETIDRLVEYLNDMPGFEKFMCFCCANHKLSEYFKEKTNHELCYESSELDVVLYIVFGMAKLTNLYYYFFPNDNRFMFAPYVTFGGIDFMDKSLLEPLHTIDMAILYFTVNNKHDAAVCIGKNCTGITTDRPDMVEELLHSINNREMQQKQNYEKTDCIISRDAVDVKWLCESLGCWIVDLFTTYVPVPLVISLLIFVLIVILLTLVHILYWFITLPCRLCLKKKEKKE